MLGVVMANVVAPFEHVMMLEDFLFSTGWSSSVLYISDRVKKDYIDTLQVLHLIEQKTSTHKKSFLGGKK
jgi:hypothetical protein